MTAIDGSAVIVELLSSGRSVRFPARGDSMHPLIREGDVLHVDPVDPALVRRGEVVLVRAMRGLTAHRVVEVSEGRILTRGDNSAGCDHPSELSDVLGRVTLLERAGRSASVRRFSGIALRMARLLERARLRLS